MTKVLICADLIMTSKLCSTFQNHFSISLSLIDHFSLSFKSRISTENRNRAIFLYCNYVQTIVLKFVQELLILYSFLLGYKGPGHVCMYLYFSLTRSYLQNINHSIYLQ